MIAALKRLVHSFHFPNRTPRAPILVRSGWNGLPEDIFVLLIKCYLGVHSKEAHSLSETCRAYSEFSRPHLFHTMCVMKDAVYNASTRECYSRIAKIRRDLKRQPQLAMRIDTLRIIDDRPDPPVVCMRFWIESRPKNKPKLTGTGKALVSDLSRHYPNLKTFELPLLKREYPWVALPLKLQDAMCDFLRRHTGCLEELSMTTQYPLELIQHCRALTRLEYRMQYHPHHHNSGLSADGGQQLSAAHAPQDPRPIALRELVVMDWAGSTLPADHPTLFATRPGPDSGSIISLKRLEKLTWYSDNSGGQRTHLPNLLSRCSNTLTSLEIYVSCHVEAPQLDLSSLRRLKHLTLSTNRMSKGPGTLSWIARVIKAIFDPTKVGFVPLQTLKITVKALGRTATECMQDMEEGWITSTIGALEIFKAASTSPSGIEGKGREPGHPRWDFRDFMVVVCIDERICPPTGPSQEEQIALVSDLRIRLRAALSIIDPSMTVDAEAVRDCFCTWLRYPSIPHAPFHY